MADNYDVVIIGSGPAGMAAAVSASDKGASVCMVEREDQIGGILKQCIHDGFGLLRFDERLTGPEYAWRYELKVRERPVDILLRTFLTGIERTGSFYSLSFVNPEKAVFTIQAKSVVMAMGCRERTDRQIFLHGERPAGIFTAGQAQDFINLKGYMPGRKCVILGSGDIGLIMARRLTIEGAEVTAVYEIGSEPAGLTRNIVQCLDDYSIPLHLRTTVREIHGRKRIESVTICKVDETGGFIEDTAVRIPCDCLILSVGLIPENDILDQLDIEMDQISCGPVVDQTLETSLPGIFSCGNALYVSDLVDHVSESGHTAGEQAAVFAAAPAAERVNKSSTNNRKKIHVAGNLKTVVPQTVRRDAAEFPVFFRPTVKMDQAVLTVKQGDRVLQNSRIKWLKPSEMHREIVDFSAVDPSGPSLTITLREGGGL